MFEIGGAIGLKYTDGFTRLWPSLLVVAGMAVSFFLLALAAKEIPIGTAYAVWAGIGAAGTAILGMILFGKSRDVLRLGLVFTVVVCIVGLKVLGIREDLAS